MSSNFDDKSLSPVNTPSSQPISEPPTPTTGHISIINDNLSPPSPSQRQSIRPMINMVPVLQQRSVPKSTYNLSQFSVTSSALSVKSIGSSIIDTDFENDGDNNSVPLAITAEDDELSEDNDPDQVSEKENLSLMQFLTEFRDATITNINSVKEQQKRDTDRLATMLQNESNRRHALEGRLHAQMLLQAETMVAMEVKLLRLESKVEKQDGQKRKHANSGNIPVASSTAVGLGLNSNHMHAQPQFMNGTGSIVANETIDEEEDFGMRDIKEIQVRTRNDSSNGHSHGQSGSDRFLNSRFNSSRDRIHLGHTNPTNIVMSSGASLASGVTATSFLEETHGVEDQHVVNNILHHGDEEDISARGNDGDVEDEGDGGEIIEGDDSASTPTQGGSRRDYRFADIQPVTNLESILLNPIQGSAPTEQGMSTRAVRGDYDGNSSLATSMTNTTVTSTIVTATTKGNDSTRQFMHDTGSINEEVELAIANSAESGVDLANSTNSLSQREDYMLGLSPQPTAHENQRPRNESPLTVQSAATETKSVASASVAASVGTSIMSTAAVAPARSFRARREAAARLGSGNLVQDGRHWANRVVSFTSDQVYAVPPEISEAGDSITMPDELDNLSDVADEFANRARLWRDEYEARLDAIQKRWGGE